MSTLCRVSGIRPKLIQAAKTCDLQKYEQFLRQRRAQRQGYVRNCDLLRFIYAVNPKCVQALAVEAGIFKSKEDVDFQ
jgi:hypothetical protein